MLTLFFGCSSPADHKSHFNSYHLTHQPTSPTQQVEELEHYSTTCDVLAIGLGSPLLPIQLLSLSLLLHFINIAAHLARSYLSRILSFNGHLSIQNPPSSISPSKPPSAPSPLSSPSPTKAPHSIASPSTLDPKQLRALQSLDIPNQLLAKPHQFDCLWLRYQC